MSQESIRQRTTALIADVQFDCNAQVVASSYAALHDTAILCHLRSTPYSFNGNGDSPTDTLVGNSSETFVLQRIITSLAISGFSAVVSHKALEKYRVKENILVVNRTVVSYHVGDPWQSMRCASWQQADWLVKQVYFVRVICNPYITYFRASNFEAATIFTSMGSLVISILSNCPYTL